MLKFPKIFVLLYFMFFFLLNLNCYSMQAPEESQSEQIKKDSHILVTILEGHNRDQFMVAPEYAQLGDRMVNSSIPHQCFEKDKPNEGFARVVELYETDKRESRLNSFRLTWLGVQLSMALTPPLQKGQKKIMSSVTQYIDILNTLYLNTPIWLQEFKILEEAEKLGKIPFFSAIKMSHIFFQPLAVYRGNSTFSTEDYFKAMSQGLFLYCLNPSRGRGHMVHGGIFRASNEKTLHDLIHFYQQWLNKDHLSDYPSFDQFFGQQDLIQQYLAAAQIWRRMASSVCRILATPNLLTDLERARFEVMSFAMMHEGIFKIPSIIASVDQPITIIKVARKAMEAWGNHTMEELDMPDDEKGFYKKYYEKTWAPEKPNYEFYKIEAISPDKVELYKANIIYILRNKRNPTLAMRFEVWVNGLGNYEYFKTFHRDLAHLLIQKNLWSVSNKKLGTTYPMKPVRNVLQATLMWSNKALNDGGKLCQLLSSS